MSNPMSISNSTSVSSNGLNGECVSPSSRLSSSPNSKSSFDLHGKKTLKSNVVKSLLNRSNSGTSLMNSGGIRRTPISSPSNFQNIYTSQDLENDNDMAPDSPKSYRESKDHSNSIGSSSGGNIAAAQAAAATQDNGANKIDKSLWTVRSLKEHPEVLDLMERVKPINRAISFGQTYASEETQFDFDPLIGRDTMLQLILQHLQFEGLNTSRKLLEEEAGVKYPEYAISESRLLTLLRASIKDSDRVFQLALDDKNRDSQQQLEEHLAFLNLFKDEKTTGATTGTNIDSPNLNQSMSSLSLSSFSISQPKSIEPNKPQVKAASLNKLVILLTPENNHDLEYTKTFLLTYQSFTTPEILLEKLIQRYHVPQKPGQSIEEWKKSAVPIQLRVANVIRTWIKDYFSDFNDRLIQNVKSLYENMRQSGNMSHAKILSEALNSKIKGIPSTADERKAPTAVFTLPAPEPKVPKNIWSASLDIFSVEEEEIARQLTLMDFEIFSNIKSTELLNQSWNKPKLRYRSPNVLTLINRFNEISQWTATSILSYERVKDRARIMAKFIRIAEYSMKLLNNFNTSMAILSGLNASSVHRLKFTKEEMPKHTQQVYAELQQQLSSSQSYKEYRALLAKANPPCLPYLGVYLTDLTFFEEGNPDFIQGYINFGKRKLIYGSISNVQSFQNAKYNLQPVYQITKLLKDFKLSTENELYKQSMKVEPRNTERNEIQ
ncbi:hypothetical protein DICPUDRAFT_46357 [Dictyostelium purpureum]|uniref:Ras guanine nucleotide exchange factor n=1 Tax=Dictyostelium purpureum TaxID=5786 RepID=F0ZEF7_DICPU|nr:uncharacterized protein DICPUDRAFT_46357 [Dictyostelium purpureum]EGC37703.1 hypothetical protein DICPUDRAFT_46357 [Dictyostelium purpureum]|eukprot:XP_003285807.1 hypothetical protein DICPUDRAFT_46357 [Dictyostelium purpureum]